MRYLNYLYLLSLLLILSCRSPGRIINEANKYALQGDYKTAISLCGKAIEKAPEFLDSYFQRGLYYESMKMDDLAIKDYKTVLSMDTKNTQALFYIGLCKFRQALFEEAIVYFNKALVTKGYGDPEDSSTTTSFLIIEPVENPFVDLRKRYDVSVYDIKYDRGLAYYQTNKIELAYYDFKACSDHEYNFAESNYMIGVCWLRFSNKENACKALGLSAFYGNEMAKKLQREECW